MSRAAAASALGLVGRWSRRMARGVAPVACGGPHRPGPCCTGGVRLRRLPRHSRRERRTRPVGPPLEGSGGACTSRAFPQDLRCSRAGSSDAPSLSPGTAMPASRDRGRGARHGGVPLPPPMNARGIPVGAHAGKRRGRTDPCLRAGDDRRHGADARAVLGLTLFGVFARPRSVSEALWIVGGGLVFPLVVLSVLLVAGFLTGQALCGRPSAGADVQVIAKQWWWEVRYLPPDSAPRRRSPIW